jgi:uncharacterized protein with GYD domain
MSTYIVLISYTEQGVRNVKDSPNRLDAAKKMISDHGGKMVATYLTMGGYDMVSIVEAPSDEMVAKIILTIGSAGNVRTTTLKAFPIVQSLP